MNPSAEITVTSGNVFADLDLPMPEELQAKATLAYQINQIIEKRQLSPKKARKMLELDKSKMIALSTGQLSQFSYEQLIQCLNQLDCDIKIEVTPKSDNLNPARITVVDSEIGI